MNAVDTLIIPNGPHVILNSRQIECRYCKKVHETITHKCRPVVFTDPQRMELHVRKVTKNERSVDLDIFAERIGKPIAISRKEALSLDPEYESREHNKEMGG